MSDGLFDDEDGADEGGAEPAAERASRTRWEDIPLAELVAATRARIQMHFGLPASAMRTPRTSPRRAC